METWKTVKGFEDYEVSNFGNVRSLSRYVTETTGKVNYLKGRILKLANDKDGYQLVTLSKDKKGIMNRVHRLVAEAFIPNPENLPMVNHKDLNVKNNHYENLEWISGKGNGRHAAINGCYEFIRGTNHPLSHFTNEDVIKIRELKGKMKQKEIAENYGVHRSTIAQIWNNKTWTHLTA